MNRIAGYAVLSIVWAATNSAIGYAFTQLKHGIYEGSLGDVLCCAIFGSLVLTALAVAAFPTIFMYSERAYVTALVCLNAFFPLCLGTLVLGLIPWNTAFLVTFAGVWTSVAIIVSILLTSVAILHLVRCLFVSPVVINRVDDPESQRRAQTSELSECAVFDACIVENPDGTPALCYRAEKIPKCIVHLETCRANE